MLEADSDAFADDIMKPFLKEYNDIDQQKKKKKNKFNFKFVGNLSIRFNKVNAQKVSS